MCQLNSLLGPNGLDTFEANMSLRRSTAGSLQISKEDGQDFDRLEMFLSDISELKKGRGGRFQEPEDKWFFFSVMRAHTCVR
jgi:hypothetical protein